MKLTPFILFLLLLFILVISILFSRFLPLNNSKEGFISFSQNKKSLDFVYIPQYSSSSNSNTVVKLYDNLFFDTKNANVIELDGSSYTAGNTVTGNTDISSPGNLDNKGISITGTYVVTRDGSINPTPYTTVIDNNEIKPNNSSESQKSDVTSKYNSWIYNTKSPNTDKYQVFYISWAGDTYIHIINTTTSKHVLSCMFSSNNLMKVYNYPSDSMLLHYLYI